MNANRLYTIEAYRTAITSMNAHEFGTEGWEAAQKIVNMIIDGMLEMKNEYIASEVAENIASLEELNEEEENEEITAQIVVLKNKLIANGFAHMVC